MEGYIAVVEDWLAQTSSGDLKHTINTIYNNDQDRLIQAIFSICEERIRCPDLFENVVKQFFLLAKSKNDKLRKFVLMFAPSLIYIYLSAVSSGEKKSVANVELTLLALYNMEVLNEQGQPRIAPFRLPSLARQSIYHEPGSLGSAPYTVDSVQRYEASDAETVRWGPLKQMTTVTASTRYHLVTAVMVGFNAHLADIPKLVLMHLCKSISRLVCQGFNRPGHHHRASYGSDGSFGIYPRPIPRIPVTPELLAELLHAVYFTMFNEFASLGIQALEDLHVRGQFELYPDVLLMTNAIKNSLKVNPSGQPSDGPMGISVALTPSTTTAPLSKSFITNASFRTKKLPDDLLEYCGDEEDLFSAQHYVDALREASPRSSGPSSFTLSVYDSLPTTARTPPQMGVNALRKLSPDVPPRNRKVDVDQTVLKQNQTPPTVKAHGKLDLHMPRRHKRTTSDVPIDSIKFDDKFMISEDERLLREQSLTPRENESPQNEKKIIGFLKSHMPFSALQNLSPNHRKHDTSDESAPSSPSISTSQNQKSNNFTNSNIRRFSAFQSAPTSPKKGFNRHSAEISTRPQAIDEDGELDVHFWKL